MSNTTVVIASRFRGPPTSANGGYTCGLLAGLLDGAAEVTLRAPPPLDTALLLVRHDDDTVVLTQGEKLIAEARATEVVLDIPPAVSFEEASRASSGYPGFGYHPYPDCFVCGPGRAAGDGLGLYPGPVAGRRVAAAPWVPAVELCAEGGNVLPRFVWAALDCPSWWGHVPFAETGPAILLGRLAAKLKALPSAGERCVVLGWPLGREGRRISCGSALFDAQGECLAWARATWIELQPKH
jgi:hypothetical protein